MASLVTNNNNNNNEDESKGGDDDSNDIEFLCERTDSVICFLNLVHHYYYVAVVRSNTKYVY